MNRPMKKITAISLTFVTAFASVGCSGSNDTADAAPEVKASDNSRLTPMGASDNKAAQTAPTPPASN